MFVGLGILHVMGMRRIVIHGLSDSTILFPRYLLTARFSGRNVIEGKLYVLIFSTNFSENFFILRRTERDTIINVHWYSCKVPVILVRC